MIDSLFSIIRLCVITFCLHSRGYYIKCRFIYKYIKKVIYKLIRVGLNKIIIVNMTQKQENKSISSQSQSQSSSDSKSSIEENDKKSISDNSAQKILQDIQEGPNKKIVRYKYCCKLCKHPDKSKKACVCVVPLSQRRADLGEGCRNCGCKGCSKQDYISKGEDPQYHPQLKQIKQGRQKLLPKKKVEVKQRKEDRRQKNKDRERQRQRQRQRERQRQRQRDHQRSRKHKNSPSRRKKHKASQSRSRSPQIIDSFNLKFHNFDRSILGNVLINEYQVNPNLLGFAIPQRTYSYIFGKPR